MFSAKNLMEFLKSCLKIGILSSLLVVLISDAMPILTSIPQAGLAGLGQIMATLLKTMLIYIGLAYTVMHCRFCLAALQLPQGIDDDQGRSQARVQANGRRPAHQAPAQAAAQGNAAEQRRTRRA